MHKGGVEEVAFCYYNVNLPRIPRGDDTRERSAGVGVVMHIACMPDSLYYEVLQGRGGGGYRQGGGGVHPRLPCVRQLTYCFFHYNYFDMYVYY